METKRCAQCHKLLRAETQTCSRCGYAFTEKKRRTTTRDLTRPSLPPASPHRAGHYSGLHPEDQPYQSSMIAVQRPPVQEPEDIRLLPEVVQEESALHPALPVGDDAPTQISVRHEKPRTEVSIPGIQHIEPIVAPRMCRENPLLDTDGALPVFYQPRQLKKTRTAKRTIPALLILSCLFFLLASGILVYVLTMGKAAPLAPSLQLSAYPTAVRSGDPFTLSGKGFAPSTQVKFTYDAHEQPINDSMQHQLEAVANRLGTFSVDVIAPTSWSVGQHTIYATDEAQQSSTSTLVTVEAQSEASPLLQLPTTRIDLGTNRAGTTSSKQVLLTNAGGGHLTWQQKSDATWLTAAPTSNSYSFSGSASITITANRSNLAPGPYTGHITITQKDSSNTVKLIVTMSVDAAPAALNVSLSSLTFAATSAQSVPAQSVTLQNSGGKPLNWQASSITNDGANWLYLVGASSGQIDPKQSQQLMVDVQAQQLAVGLYQGTITLTGGANATINVSLTVVAPGNILVTPTTLTFSALTGQSVAGKTLTMQNTGGQAQGWSVVATADQGSWLSVTQQSGLVSAGAQAQVAVNINTAGLKATVYQGTLTFTVGNQLTSVPVTLTVTTPPSATISVQSTTLTFQTTQGTNPIGQMLTITNTGNAMLNWMARESGNGATFAPLSVYSGSIPPQARTFVEVNPSVSASPAGTLKTTITIADSDVGTTVVSQNIAVTVVILSEAAISALPSNFNLTATGTTPTTHIVTITNTGTAPLNWNALVRMEVPVGGTWLSVDTPSGTLAPGASKNIVVSCDGTGLPKGSAFQGSIQIVDSDTGTVVPPQTVYLTFFP